MPKKLIIAAYLLNALIENYKILNEVYKAFLIEHLIQLLKQEVINMIAVFHNTCIFRDHARLRFHGIRQASIPYSIFRLSE